MGYVGDLTQSDAAAADVLGTYAGVTNCRILGPGPPASARLYYSGEGCLFVYGKGVQASKFEYRLALSPFHEDAVELGPGRRGPDLIIGGTEVAMPRKHANRILALRRQFDSSPLSLMGLRYAGEPLPVVDPVTIPDDGDCGPRAQTWAVFPDGDSGRLTIGESLFRFTSEQSGQMLNSALNEIVHVHAEPSAGAGQARLTVLLTGGRAMTVAVSKAFAQLAMRRFGEWRGFWLTYPPDVVPRWSPLHRRNSFFSDLATRYERQQEHIFQIAGRVDLTTVEALLDGLVFKLDGFGVIDANSPPGNVIDVAAKIAIAQASIGWFQEGTHPAVAAALSALERTAAERVGTDASDLVWAGFAELWDSME